MAVPELPVCPKSGLLRSRCRCSDPQCYGRTSAHDRRESGGQRRARVRRMKKREAQEQAQKDWMQNHWTLHAMAHPEIWSPGYAETHPLKGFGHARDN